MESGAEGGCHSGCRRNLDLRPKIPKRIASDYSDKGCYRPGWDSIQNSLSCGFESTAGLEEGARQSVPNSRFDCHADNESSSSARPVFRWHSRLRGASACLAEYASCEFRRCSCVGDTGSDLPPISSGDKPAVGRARPYRGRTAECGNTRGKRVEVSLGTGLCSEDSSAHGILDLTST